MAFPPPSNNTDCESDAISQRGESSAAQFIPGGNCAWCKTPLKQPLPPQHSYCIFHGAIEAFGLAMSRPIDFFWPNDFCHKPTVEIPTTALRCGLLFCLSSIYFLTTWEVLLLSRWFFIQGSQGLFPSTIQAILYGLAALPIASLAYQGLSWFFRYITNNLALQYMAVPKIETHNTLYPVKCIFCEKDLPADPPVPPPEAFEKWIPFPKFIRKENVRQCPHCSGPVKPQLPPTVDNPWRHVWWLLLAMIITFLVGLYQQKTWVTILLGIEIWGVAYTGLRTWRIAEISWGFTFSQPNFESLEERLRYQQAMMGLTFGIPLGIFFTTSSGLIWSPQTPLCWTAPAGFFLGIVVIRWYIFQASVAYELFLQLCRIFKFLPKTPGKA